jgi:hypothetical protein
MRRIAGPIVLTILAAGLAGCCPRITSAPPSAATRNSPDGVAYESYRMAQPADLRLSISGMKHGTKGFPYVLLMLQNTSRDQVIVAYTAGGASVHCGHYVQPGPAETFGLRRQILDPGGFILLDPPEAGWTGLTSDGQPELMIPTTLPPGKYDVWATFQLATPTVGVIATDKRVYEPQ